jgi:hypothetical protein
MNIVLTDAQGILSEQQESYARNRLLYSLARFSHRVRGATMHVSVDDKCEQASCMIDVDVENVGLVSIRRTSVSCQEALNLAVDAIEPKIAWRVDWSMWFNAETLATSMLWVGQPLKWFQGFAQPLLRSPSRQATALSGCTVSSSCTTSNALRGHLLKGLHFRSQEKRRNRSPP